jgi:hypothetical protein
VDDFGIRYIHRAVANHLIATLQGSYDVSLDSTRAKYCGLSLKWDYYTTRTCDMSMPGYIERAFHRFQRVPGLTPEHAPHQWQRPNYSATTQFATVSNSSPSFDANNKTRIVLEVLGTLLSYTRAIEYTLLTSIGELATE